MEKHLNAYLAKQNEDYSEHFVEDARSAPAVHIKAKKDKRHFGKGKTVLLTAAITLLCFSLTLVFADLLSGRTGISVYTSLFQRKQNGCVFYAVYATHSPDMALCYKNAAVVREEGGAGYVMKQGSEYYVVLNLYADENDAKKVKERKENYGIFEIFVPDIAFNKHKSLAAAKNSRTLYKEVYSDLYEAANDLAAEKYQKQDMFRLLASHKEAVIAVENAYAERIKGSEDQAAIEYKVILAEMRSAFENLEHNSDHPVADARYYATMIVHSFSLFAQKYAS